MKLLNNKKCPFCSGTQLYTVSKTSLKCSTCKKKYSFTKLQKDYQIMELFCEDKSAKACADILNLNYKTIKDRYMDYRKLIIIHVEQQYRDNNSRFSEYDEYYFLHKNKRGKVKYLFDSIGVLGQIYDDTVYTILLPDQFAHLKEESLYNPRINYAYLKEYSKYLNRSKIVHYEKFDSQIIRFWVFLEKKLLHFKGISRKNFAYYLKEYEFKFNFTQDEQKSILWNAWINIKR